MHFRNCSLLWLWVRSFNQTWWEPQVSLNFVTFDKRLEIFLLYKKLYDICIVEVLSAGVYISVSPWVKGRRRFYISPYYYTTNVFQYRVFVQSIQDTHSALQQMFLPRETNLTIPTTTTRETKFEKWFFFK